VNRTLIGALCVVIVLGAPTAVVAAHHGSGSGAASAARKITLRGREPGPGPWRTYLWLKLVKVKLKSFELCAVWDQPNPLPNCRSKAGKALPPGTILRLEQRPVGKGVRVSDSPGWGLIGTSNEPSLGAVLSNAVTGNRFGTVTYRVTLRNAEGGIVARSNPFKVAWHR
jgi:hypothetical protein